MAIRPWKNVYEEPAEQLKELVKHEANNKGKHLPEQTKNQRKILLKTHEQQCKLLSEGHVPTKRFILPLPYPPSRYSFTDERCQKVLLKDLLVEERNPKTIIILKTITQPYIHSSTETLVEDEAGQIARLTVCNQEDTLIEPMYPSGTVVAIKQPCWTRLFDGGYHIRIDHPSDIVILDSDDALVPNKESWKASEEDPGGKEEKEKKDWKKEGDTMFLKKCFRRALVCYENALAQPGEQSDPTAAIDIYRKKCGVNNVLLRIEDAIKDLAAAISIHISSSSSSPKEGGYPATDKSTITAWLQTRSFEDPLKITNRLSKPLHQLSSRIKFDLGVTQPSPSYNIPQISSSIGPLSLHIDAANYICDTEILVTEFHGRGLFAKRAFKAGELVVVEKAYVMPGYFIQDKSSECNLYCLEDGTASARSGALLFKELVQKLKWNGGLGGEFFGLNDGGYWERHGWSLTENEEIPVDVFRIEKIRQRNCFSAPARSLDLLLLPTHSAPELRNGLWLHAAYLNHSCLPNTVRSFMGDVLFLRATRDIAAGEELTHQYVAPAISIAERQKSYREIWNFECDCALCVVDGNVLTEKKEERMRRFEELKSMVMRLGERGMTISGIKKIARATRELEALYSPSTDAEKDHTAGEGEDPYAKLPRLALVHPTLFLTEAWKGVGNADRTIEYARKLLRNFGILTREEDGVFEARCEAGLVNVEAMRAMKYLVQAYRAKGEEELAGQCLAVAKVWFAVVTGGEVGVDEFFGS